MSAYGSDEQQAIQSLQHAIGERYDVLERIGGGGMAEVYLARHRLHGGFCAVKVLADHLARDESIVSRFLQEARTAAALEGHPNIVRIVDIGQSNGLYYLLMPYVDGEDLESYLERRGRLTVEDACYVIRQVAEGLAWAHQRGVVHRDLKPANVRLDPRGGITVLDFGIAKAQALGTMTQVGEKLGTSYYMSPEQIRGESVDHRSDLYSLGVMFYELLTGERPFTGETHFAIEQGHLNEDPPAPDERDPSIPAEVGDVVHFLLQKRPEERYQSAQDVIAVLETWGPGRAPDGLRPERDTRLETYRQTRPEGGTQAFTRDSGSRQEALPPVPIDNESTAKPLLLLLAAVVVLAGAVAGVLWWANRPAPPAPDPAPVAGTSENGAVTPDPGPPPPGMALVPAGNFSFGDAAADSPNPRSSVYVGAFYIDRHEVSNRAYKEFCDQTARPYPAAASWDADYFTAKPDYPVVNVTFEDAESYAAWAGKRLPTEEEWEKAARGDDGRIYPWGFSSPITEANAEGRGDGHAETSPVSAFPDGASPYGALNMSGNVWEWTATKYPVTPEEMADMQSVMRESSSEWRVLKGGSFVTPADDRDLSAYMRAGSPINGKNPSIGFRCVKDAN